MRWVGVDTGVKPQVPHGWDCEGSVACCPECLKERAVEFWQRRVEQLKRGSLGAPRGEWCQCCRLPPPPLRRGLPRVSFSLIVVANAAMDAQ